MLEPTDGTASVLVVDDEAALRRATARHLRAAGYAVVEAHDGPSAAVTIAAQAFDAIVCDIDMPGLSGIELLRMLRERSITTPVVLITGRPTLDTAMQAVEHGAFKYLMKPVDASELKATVAKAVAGAPRAPESATRLAGPGSTRAGVAPGGILAERYRLRTLIGKGGMGELWEAEQVVTGRAVAVKLLHASLNAMPAMRRRLLREARAASQVGHPNVVDVFDAFELGDGTPVLVMALLRGRTLAAKMDGSGPLSLPAAADILLPIVSAVGTAHAHGVVHRDLKPDNVFLCEEDGRTIVKVVDFGIAKLGSGDEGPQGKLTATGVQLGTPGYMSPEQALGDRDVDARADVWSLGVMTYELLSGKRPVEADTVGRMLQRLFTESIAPIRSHLPDLPGRFADLVDRMLSRERDDRPADLCEFFDELARHAGVSAPAFGRPGSVVKETPSGTVPTADVALAYARTEQGDVPIVGAVAGARKK